MEIKFNCLINLAPHKKYPTLTKFQYEFFQKMFIQYKWVARDGYKNHIYFYENKPIKRNNVDCAWQMPMGKYYLLDEVLDDYDFIKWDNEPWSILKLLENCKIK